MSNPVKSLRLALAWRRDALARWLLGRLACLGPRAFIALRWPWPLRKPFQRATLTVRAPGGGLGDELMCMPILDEIKKRNPACRITFLTRRPDYFRPHPSIDDARLDDPAIPALRLAYDYLKPPPRPLPTLMAEYAGIRGFFPRMTPPAVNPTDMARRAVADLPRPLVVVQLQSSEWTVNKNWPLENWLAVVRELTQRCSVIEVGVKPLLPAEELGPHFLSMAGRTSLEDYAWLISQADLFAGPSSSGMHLANGYGVPAVILFGGYESPDGYRFPNVHPFYTAVHCAPCWRQTCPYHHECLHAVKPDAVLSRILELLPAPRAGGNQRGGL